MAGNFLRDLRRWTEAELRRRAKKKDMAHAIRRLIDYPFTGEGRDPLGRGTIPGQVGIALRQANDPLDPSLPFALDVGLIGGASAPTWPLPVYSGTALRAYLAGTGTYIPETDTDEYLLGLAGHSVTACTNGAVPDWLDAAPTLDGNNAYPSTLYTESAHGAPTTRASTYTGLLRLAVQAKNGARRDDTELSAGETLDGATHGLVRDADYVYWLISASANGVTAQKLRTGSNTVCIQEMLADGSFTGADIPRAEAWLLADLETDTDESPLTLIAAAGMTGVHDGDREPLAHGWHFARDGSEASIVTFREGAAASAADWYWEWTLARLDLGFDVSGDPTSALVIEEADIKAGWNYNTTKRLWRPDENSGMCLVRPSQVVVVSEHGTQAPLYAYYDDSSNRQVARIDEDEAYPGGATTFSDFLFCVPGSGTGEYRSYSGNVVHGGFFCADVDYTGYSSDSLFRDKYTVESSVQFEDTLRFSGDGGPVWKLPPCGYTQSEYNTWIAEQIEIIEEISGCLHFDGGTTTYARTHMDQTYHRERETLTPSTQAQFMLIPADDAEAVLLGRRNQFSLTNRAHSLGHWENDGLSTKEGQRYTSAIGGQAYGGDCETSRYVEEAVQSQVSSVPTGSTSSYSSNWPLAYSLFVGTPIEDSSGIPADSTESDSTTQLTYLRTTVEVTDSPTAWSPAYSSPPTGCAPTLDELFSAAYDDGLIYADDVGSNVISGGFATPQDFSTALWVGWE